jgi:hypothetical protein
MGPLIRHKVKYFYTVHEGCVKNEWLVEKYSAFGSLLADSYDVIYDPNKEEFSSCTCTGFQLKLGVGNLAFQHKHIRMVKNYIRACKGQTRLVGFIELPNNIIEEVLLVPVFPMGVRSVIPRGKS